MKLTTADEARRMIRGDKKRAEERDDRVHAAIRTINLKIKERVLAGQTCAMIGMGITYESLKALTPVEYDELLFDLKSAGYGVVIEGYEKPFFRLEWAEPIKPNAEADED